MKDLQSLPRRVKRIGGLPRRVKRIGGLLRGPNGNRSLLSTAQRIGRLFLCAALILPAAANADAQPKPLLQHADSLFRARQYTDAYTIYDSLLASGSYSPSMLLKMAYIQEGLNATGRTLYLLNMYYFATYDESALEKINELASKHNLQGYGRTDFDTLHMFYGRYKVLVTWALVGICFAFIALIAFRKKAAWEFPFVMLIIFTALLFAHINVGWHADYAIAADQNTYIMSAPSAGAKLVEVIGEGNKMPVHGVRDVWIHVDWNGRDAYVKSTQVIEVTL